MNYTDEFIMHHGVKGQKWGIRRKKKSSNSGRTGGKKESKSTGSSNQSKSSNKNAKRKTKLKRIGAAAGTVAIGAALVKYGPTAKVKAQQKYTQAGVKILNSMAKNNSHNNRWLSYANDDLAGRLQRIEYSHGALGKTFISTDTAKKMYKDSNKAINDYYKELPSVFERHLFDTSERYRKFAIGADYKKLQAKQKIKNLKKYK